MREMMKLQLEFNKDMQKVVKQKESFGIFIKYAPVPFSRTINPIEDEEWIANIEKFFIDTKCKEDEKVTRGNYLLRCDAEKWCQVKKREKEGQHIRK